MGGMSDYEHLVQATKSAKRRFGNLAEECQQVSDFLLRGIAETMGCPAEALRRLPCNYSKEDGWTVLPHGYFDENGCYHFEFQLVLDEKEEAEERSGPVFGWSLQKVDGTLIFHGSGLALQLEPHSERETVSAVVAIVKKEAQEWAREVYYQ